MLLISIIIPVLNEAPGLAACLHPLLSFRQRGCELIVVDGGSTDQSVEIAHSLADQVLVAPKGRASQMNAGAREAQGEILWFLHADSLPPAEADTLIRTALHSSGHRWGRFDIRLSGKRASLRMVETFMNWRSFLTGIATGDQGIFVYRSAFQQVGGYPAIPLMEDIALSKRLKRMSRPACLHPRLLSSSRRWEKNGVGRTIVLMWRLRLAYFLGADPAYLAHIYYGR
jgi:rSAM/selenodomain-associated transferase 2